MVKFPEITPEPDWVLGLRRGFWRLSEAKRTRRLDAMPAIELAWLLEEQPRTTTQRQRAASHNRIPRCPAGHIVLVTQTHCRDCGQYLGKAARG